MTDKEKIRAEIERLYNQSLADEKRQANLGLERAADISYGKSKACKELLSFIDTLQKEHISEDLEEAARRYNEEMSWRWEAPNYPHMEAFKEGARWQKQQMMKDAVEGKVTDERSYSSYEIDEIDITVDYNKDTTPFTVEDEVKLIIIKEDKV